MVTTQQQPLACTSHKEMYRRTIMLSLNSPVAVGSLGRSMRREMD